MIGFMGAHRVGKTSLARAVGELPGFSFCETGLSDTLRLLGVDPQADLPLFYRLRVQIELVRALEGKYVEALEGGGLVVTDRTPLDVLAYSQSEVSRSNLTPAISALFEEHRHECYRMAHRHFSHVIVVPPGIVMVSDPDKATANEHYQRNVHANILEVALNDMNNIQTHFIPQKMLSFSRRKEEVIQFLSRYDDFAIRTQQESV